MKTTNLFATGLISASLLLMACGGSTNNTAETAEMEDPAEEMVDDTPAEIENIAIDPTQSTIHWKGEMLGMYSHEGTIDLKEGYISYEDGNLIGGGFIIDMATITPTDENYQPEEGNTPEKLVGHLSSADFFDVANHPTSSFDILSMEGNSATGRITIRGKEGEQTIDNVSITDENGQKVLKGSLTINRKNYDVSFDHPVKEMVLSDDIAVEVELRTMPSEM